jgi:hypothetical protein
MARYSVLNSFYASERWGKFRAQLIAKRGNKCEKCGKIIAKSIDIIGHHEIELTPENCLDTTISLNPSLVKLICRSCHDEEHNRFCKLQSRKVFIVYGSPLSGKREYVNQNIRRGDLVVDIDSIYSAVSFLPSFDKPDSLFSNIIGVHNLLIDNIKTRYGKWGSAWVIGGYADKYKREKLADDLGAELVFCDVSQDECLRRLEMDERLQYRKDEWRSYIEKWFREYVR